MSRNPALENAIRIVAHEVGICAPIASLMEEIPELADRVGMRDELQSRPRSVAAEITRYLDDIARDP